MAQNESRSEQFVFGTFYGAGCNLGTPKLFGTLIGSFMGAPESWDWDAAHAVFVSQTVPVKFKKVASCGMNHQTP